MGDKGGRKDKEKRPEAERQQAAEAGAEQESQAAEAEALKENGNRGTRDHGSHTLSPRSVPWCITLDNSKGVKFTPGKAGGLFL